MTVMTQRARRQSLTPKSVSISHHLQFFWCAFDKRYCRYGPDRHHCVPAGNLRIADNERLQRGPVLSSGAAKGLRVGFLGAPEG
jgi:hypothetical protein